MNASGPDIRDIRPPFWIALDWRVPALIGLAVVALLALTLWGWRRYRARHVTLTLAARTLQRLETARSLMGAGDAQAFSTEVSAAVRAYIEERFNVLATHLTTSEFLRDCVAQLGSVLQGHEDALGEFLRYCDLAKFARWSLSVQQMEGMLASARNFIESTATPIAARSAIASEDVDVPIRQS